MYAFAHSVYCSWTPFLALGERQCLCPGYIEVERRECWVSTMSALSTGHKKQLLPWAFWAFRMGLSAFPFYLPHC